MNPALLYIKCEHCHLFVEANDAALDDDTFAAYVHLHRGDEADEALDATHEAEPGRESHTLDWWQENGPAEMRARFTDNKEN